MNDMKKLSILAAGVAVLSMCACTEANEFTPSTNGSTKKITEIKVSSNPSALGTRTVFDTSEQNFGAVKWEENGDELYFFKSGTNANPQVFLCGAAADKNDDTYDWHYFEAEGSGLDIDENYTAYYFPPKATKKGDFSTSYETMIVNHHLMYTSGGSEKSVLSDFMSNYDLLMSSTPRYVADENPTPAIVLAQEEMESIYMDHAFALVTLNIECIDNGKYSDYYEMPYFSAAELSAKTGTDDNSPYSIKIDYSINSNGVLEFSQENFVTSLYDNLENLYYLTKTNVTGLPDESKKQKQSNKLSFYFLIHPTEPVKMLTFYIDTHARKSDDPLFTEYIDKSVVITYENPVNFIPGKCYNFDLNVNYNNGDKTTPFSCLNDWKKNDNAVTLVSCPDQAQNDMYIESVEYGYR